MQITAGVKFPIWVFQVGQTIEGYVSSIKEDGNIFFQVQGPGHQMLMDLTADMADTYAQVRVWL